MKLSEVIALWDQLHLKDTGDLGFNDVLNALEAVTGVENDIPQEQPKVAYERVEPCDPRHGCCDTYSVLVGPGDFYCFLGEPEDSNWHRDGSKAVERLNELHELLNVGLTLVAKSIGHGMPITKEVADWRNKTVQVLNP